MSIFNINLLLFTTTDAAVLKIWGKKILYYIYFHYSLPYFSRGAETEINQEPAQTNLTLKKNEAEICSNI